MKTTITRILDGKFRDKKVAINGWVVTKRSSGGVQFLLIRDGTGVIQATVHKDKVPHKIFVAAEKLTQESSVKVSGVVIEDQRAPNGYELRVADLEHIHVALEYPLAKKTHGTDFLMNYRHLWIRSEKQRAILKVRAEVTKACHEFFDQRGYVLVDTPIFTPAACEETSTLFQTEYFGRKAYLTQSAQLYLEAAIGAFSKVYSFAPSFRAEKSRTRRHLTEFWQVEPEMAFMNLEECIEIQESLIFNIVKSVLRNCVSELDILKRDISPLKKVVKPFPRIHYTEAVDLLREGGLQIEWGEDFGAPHEKFLSLKFDKPLVVHRYPAYAKAFYMRADPEDPRVVLCDDVLAPEGYGEIIGGSERIWELKELEKKIKEFKLPRENYEWYIDLRKYGSVPHSGFGMGIERVVMWICKLRHIRESIPFPRTMRRLYP